MLHQLLCTLSVVQQILQVSPLPHRNLLLWSAGILMLTGLFHFPSHCLQSYKWRSRLRALHATPGNYHFQHVCSNIVVYVKLHCSFHTGNRFQLASNSCYVGSTTKSISGRESARVSKLNRVIKGALTFAEPSIRWWAHHGNYFEFVTICLCVRPTVETVLATEHTFISQWRAKLNYPYIVSHLQLNATG